MIVNLNCKSYSKYGQCLHKDQKRSLLIFRKECVLLGNHRMRRPFKKCPLREKYPKPKCPPPSPAKGGTRESNNRDEITVDNVIAWADGITGALGTEHANKVTDLEAVIANAVVLHTPIKRKHNALKKLRISNRST